MTIRTSASTIGSTHFYFPYNTAYEEPLPVLDLPCSYNFKFVLFLINRRVLLLEDVRILLEVNDLPV